MITIQKILNLMITVIASMVFVCTFARSETLITDLSQHVIEITSQFSGQELLLFGAIERHVADVKTINDITVQGLGYDIIVVVQNEPTNLMIRKKEKVAGIWVNNESQIMSNVPGYYVIGSTRPLDDFLSKDKQIEYSLGLNNLKFSSSLNEDFGDYKDALIRNMIAKGLYSESSGNVIVKSEILFSARLNFPANMPIGNYKADVYLIRDGDIIINHHTDLLVDKRGFERIIYNFAHDYPAYYGLIAVFVALSVGLFTGFVAKKIS
ncbi:MAG: TIGR02186 family protein [Proteobacteria bacterium]|nr:TIGR02186 family protein [Pseudomonadota bacterium]